MKFSNKLLTISWTVSSIWIPNFPIGCTRIYLYPPFSEEMKHHDSKNMRTWFFFKVTKRGFLRKGTGQDKRHTQRSFKSSRVLKRTKSVIETRTYEKEWTGHSFIPELIVPVLFTFLSSSPDSPSSWWRRRGKVGRHQTSPTSCSIHMLQGTSLRSHCRKIQQCL